MMKLTPWVVIILMLSLSMADSFMEKKDCKLDTVWPSSHYYIKMVYELLIKIITVYIKFFLV